MINNITEPREMNKRMEINEIRNEIKNEIEEMIAKQKKQYGTIKDIIYALKMAFGGNETVKSMMQKELAEILPISEKISKKKKLIIIGLEDDLEITLKTLEKICENMDAANEIFGKENDEPTETIKLVFDEVIPILKQKVKEAIDGIDRLEAKIKGTQDYIALFDEHIKKGSKTEIINNYFERRNEIYGIIRKYQSAINEMKWTKDQMAEFIIGIRINEHAYKTILLIKK